MLAVALAVAAASASPRDVSAAPSARLVYLRNPGAESCPDEGAVRSAVAARLGYDPFFPYAPTTLFAEIERTSSGYVAQIKLVDGASTVLGSRELRQAGERCADIIDTMALSISIAIDPDSLTRPPGTPPTGAVEPAPAPAEPEREAPPPPPSDRPKGPPPERPSRPAPAVGHTVAIDLGVAPAVSLGAAPAVSVGASAFVRARRRALSLAVEGRYDLPASRSVEGATVETSLATGALVPCLHFGIASACALAALGSIRASSRGVLRPRTSSAIHAAVGPRVTLDLPLTERLSLRAHVDALFPLTVHSLELDGASIYTLPRASASLGVGVVVRAL